MDFRVLGALEVAESGRVLALGARKQRLLLSAVTARQVRAVVERLIEADHWAEGDPEILVVFDAGYDVPRLGYRLRDLPVQMLGRLRSDRVMRRPIPPRDGRNGRPPRHGAEFVYGQSESWGDPDGATVTETTRHGTAYAAASDQLRLRLTRPAPRHDVGRILATGDAYERPAHHKKGKKGTKPRRTT